MTWSPPPDVRAAGEAAQGQIPNVQGSVLTSDDVASIQRAVAPGTRVLATFLRSRWSLSSAGTARGASIRAPARRADGSLRRRDVHEEGRAIDAMIGTDRAKGAEIANWCVLHARALGLQYVIWDRYEWSSSTYATAWEAYTGTSPHTDHVHVEVTPALASSGEAMRAAIASVTGEWPPPIAGGSSSPAPHPAPPSSVPSPAPIAVESGGGAVLAGAAVLAGTLLWAWRKRGSR